MFFDELEVCVVPEVAVFVVECDFLGVGVGELGVVEFVPVAVAGLGEECDVPVGLGDAVFGFGLVGLLCLVVVV